jgi:large subunit ribosomal protein L28
MAKCENCGKSPSFGHNVSHSNVRTKRQWKPNIQKVTVYKDGRPQRVKLCTRCIRTMNKVN